MIEWMQISTSPCKVLFHQFDVSVYSDIYERCFNSLEKCSICSSVIVSSKYKMLESHNNRITVEKYIFIITFAHTGPLLQQHNA